MDCCNRVDADSGVETGKAARESLQYGAGNGRASPCSECRVAPAIQLELLLEHFLDLADLFFNFAGPVFGFAFGL